MELKLSPEKVFNTSDFDKISEYMYKYWPQEVEHILRIANDVSHNTFLFDRPWDMEPTIQPVTFKDEINWEFMPEEDDEWIFMIARHGYAAQLGEAYSLTKDEKYVKHFIRLVCDFIDRAKFTKESIRTTWRTIDSAIRVENWLKAYVHLKDSPLLTKEFMDKFMNSLMEHGEYLHSVHDSFRTISNWGVLQNQGLFMLGAFLSEQAIGKDYMHTALIRLEEQATVQVFEDGVHWEQSPMYHNEVLHGFQNVIFIAKRCGITLPQVIVEKTKKMCYTNMNWAKPNHKQVNQGDSDNTDIRDMVSRGAYLFGDSQLKFGGFDRLDPVSCWYEGLEAIQSYEKMPITKPSYTSIAMQESGNYYLRNNWSEGANYLHFHCGSLGSGHGHADLLHIDLFAGGEDILVDSGRFTYIHKPIRTDFKSSFAHNTTVVDNLPFTECTQSWEFGKVASYVQNRYVDQGNIQMVEGSHLGYMDLPSGGVFTNRKVIYIQPDIYVVIDTFTGEGEHTYDQLFHFNNKGIVTQENQIIRYESNQVKATLQCVTPGVETSVYDSLLSWKYNEIEDNKAAKFSLKGQGNTCMITVITTSSAECKEVFNCEKIDVVSMMTGKVHSDKVAEAVKITKGEEEYTILVAHKDSFGSVDIALANGYRGYGKVRVFDKLGKLTVLSW